MELTASEVARLTEGDVLVGNGHVVASSFAIDSRVVEPGGCFVALTAARDGHDFVGDAFTRGATTAIVSRRPAFDVPASAAVVRVDDPLAALGRLGGAARRALPDARVVGVTGSTGKTGTKDLVAGALAARHRVHASPLSFNNEAGVPLSLLAAPPDSENVVLELGARFPGNIAALCEIARPTVGVVTNVGLAHAGLLGGVEGVARAKGELLEALAPGSLAVLNGDDPSTRGLRARTRADLVTAAVTDRGADVRGSRVELDAELRARFLLESSWGRTSVALGVHGAHQVTNALLAAAVALWAGVEPDEVAAGLAAVRGGAMRMEVVRARGGPVVLNDAYNANPASMAAAIDALAASPSARRRIAVLGAMRELGEWSEQEHARVGRQVADALVDVLVAVGSDTAALASGARSRARGGPPARGVRGGGRTGSARAGPGSGRPR